MQGMAQRNQASIKHTKEKAEMAHIKTAQNGEQKIALSTPEWIRIGLERGFLQMDPRVAEHGRNLAKSAGIDPDKATYTTLKKAMQTPEIMEKLAANMDKAPVKTAQYQIPRNIDQQVGQDQGGYGLGTAATIGGIAASPYLLNAIKERSLAGGLAGGNAFYRNLGQRAGSLLGLGGNAAAAVPAAGAAAVPAATNAATAGAGAAGTGLKGMLGKGLGFAGRALASPLGLAGLGLGGAYLGYQGVKALKELNKGDASPNPLFMQDQKAQQKAMRAIDRFNSISPGLKGMSSSIDEHIDAVGAAVTDTMQAMQTAAPTAMSPQFASQEEERAAQLAALQQQIAAAQAANQKNILGPRIPAPAGLGGGGLAMTPTPTGQ